MSRKLFKTTRTKRFDEIICDYCKEQIGIIDVFEGEEVPDSWKSINSGMHHCPDCLAQIKRSYDSYVDPKRAYH